jgi:hypothetical protein
MRYNRSFPVNKFQSPSNRLLEEKKLQPSFFKDRKNTSLAKDYDIINTSLKSVKSREQGEIPDSEFNNSINAINKVEEGPHYNFCKPEKGVQTQSDEFYLAPKYPP